MKRSLKRIIAGVLIFTMSVSLPVGKLGSLPERAKAATTTWEPAGTDDWVQSSVDSKWRKVVSNFEDKELTTTETLLSNSSHNAATTGKWFSTEAGGTVKITGMAASSNSLSFKNISNNNSAFYKVDLDGVETTQYELRMYAKRSQSEGTGNGAISFEVKNGDTVVNGNAYNLTSGKDVTGTTNKATYNMSKNDTTNYQMLINLNNPGKNPIFAFRVWGNVNIGGVEAGSMELVAVSDTKPEPPPIPPTQEPAGADWTIGSDGLYRKIVDDFRGGLIVGENMPETKISTDPSNLSNTWYNANSNPVKINMGENGALKITSGIEGDSLYYIMDLAGYEAAIDYEIRFKVKKTGTPYCNAEVRTINSNERIKGTVRDMNTNASIGVIDKDVEMASTTIPGSGNSKLEAIYNFKNLNKLAFKLTSNNVNGPNILDISQLELIAISRYNLDIPTQKAINKIMPNDLIEPHNAGGFENWPGVTQLQGTIPAPLVSSASGAAVPMIMEALPTSPGAYSLPVPLSTGVFVPDVSNPYGDISATGKIEIINKGRYKVNHSAQMSADSELTIKMDRLKANTEYTIFFTANPSGKPFNSNDSASYRGSELQFRLSGFKEFNDEAKFPIYDYDNGNYNNGDAGRTWTQRNNMYNWLENLVIRSMGGWQNFRYDFTTGSNSKNGVLARFKALYGEVLLDEIYIVERSTLDELTNDNNILPPNTELSRGNRAIIDQGIQFQTWFSNAPLKDVREIDFTALQYGGAPSYNLKLHNEAKENGGKPLKWSTAFGPKGAHISSTGQDGDAGLPTEYDWDNGFLTEEWGANDLENLVSICMGDEENYSDTLVQNLKSWFETMRKHYDDAPGRTTPIILHHNEVGNTPQQNLAQISTFNLDMLRKYIRTAKPDMISYDMYYFRERRVEQTVGGTVIGFYDDLNRYRIAAAEGLDGTGQQPIPFGQYNYAWRTGPGGGSIFKRGDGWHEMTESQVNLYTFGTYAFGGKWMSNFSWSDNNNIYTFYDTDKMDPENPGRRAKYRTWYIFQELIRQSKNLGPHLTRLNAENVAIVRGQNLRKEDGTVVMNNKPADNPDFSAIKSQDMNKRTFIDDIKVKNLGEQNDKLNGDVFVTYFNPLTGLTDKDKEVFTSTDPRYFTLLNGLTAGDGLPVELQQGSSYETRQQVTVTFKDLPAGAKLKKVSRVDKNNQGAVIDVPLVNGNQLVTTIGGGMADLYYWELGDKKATSSVQADETGLENLMYGKQEYETVINKKDMGGKTITVGNIKGTRKMEPEQVMGRGLNEVPEENTPGAVINLNNTLKTMGNITSILQRYYTLDMWGFRTDYIPKHNNVNLEFEEYGWTKEELIQNVKKVKAGKKVPGMPDIMTVPVSWLVGENNLISNGSVLPLDGIKELNLEDEKWNSATTKMATINGKTYGASNKVNMDAVGMAVNKQLLKKVSTDANPSLAIYKLQRDGQWTIDELNKLIAKAKADGIANQGIKLFPDNDYLITSILTAFGVDSLMALDANSVEYKEAMAFYKDLKDSNLLLPSTGSLEDEMKAFSEGKLIFLVEPYTKIASQINDSWTYLKDNILRTTGPVQKWGIQNYAYPAPGAVSASGETAYTVTVTEIEKGKYHTGVNGNWAFLLFPKKDTASEYKAVLNEPECQVMLSTTANTADTAIIWDKLASEFKGYRKEMGSDMFKYPLNRGNPGIEGNTNEANLRDSSTLNLINNGAGYAAPIKESGLYEEVLKKFIGDESADPVAINTAVKDYIDKIGLADNTAVPETPDENNGGGSGGGGVIVVPPTNGGGAPAVPDPTPGTDPSKPALTIDSETNVQKVVEEIGKASSKETIIIDIKEGTTKVPADIFSAAKDKDITLKFMQNGVNCYINGKSIGTLSSKVESYDIKATKINNKTLTTVAKKKDVQQFEVAYKGKMPFTMKVEVTVDKKQKGKMLYYNYYNTDKKRLEYTAINSVDKNGTMFGDITKGGKYVISTECGYVAKPIKSITGTTNQKLGKNNKVQLTVKVSPSNYTVKPVQWKVSNSKFATVDSNGVVKAKKAGLGKTIKVSANALDNSGKKKVFTIKLSQK